MKRDTDRADTATADPTLWDRIEYWSTAAGLSQSALAAEVGVQPSAVSNWKAGIAKPHADTIERVAAACGVTMAVFWGPLPARARG